MSKRGLLVPLQPEPPRAFHSCWPNSDKPERKRGSVCAPSEGKAFLEDQKQHQRDKVLILLELKEQLSLQKNLFSPAASTDCFKKEPLFRGDCWQNQGGFPRQ